MIAFVLRRVLQSVTVMLAVGLIAFGLFRFVGDPINNMVGQDTGDRDRAELRKSLGLDDPFIVQFVRFLGNAAHGEFGVSYRQGRRVSTLSWPCGPNSGLRPRDGRFAGTGVRCANGDGRR